MSVEIVWQMSNHVRDCTDGKRVQVHPDDHFLIRDSKLGDESPELRFTAGEWLEFLAGPAASWLARDTP